MKNLLHVPYTLKELGLLIETIDVSSDNVNNHTLRLSENGRIHLGAGHTNVDCTRSIIRFMSVPGSHRESFIRVFLELPLSDMPLYINTPSDQIRKVVKWRMSIGK